MTPKQALAAGYIRSFRIENTKERLQSELEKIKSQGYKAVIVKLAIDPLSKNQSPLYEIYHDANYDEFLKWKTAMKAHADIIIAHEALIARQQKERDEHGLHVDKATTMVIALNHQVMQNLDAHKTNPAFSLF